MNAFVKFMVLIALARIAFIISLIIWGVFTVGFAHNPAPAMDSLGFLGGAFHGMIAGISLIASFFDPSITIYARTNTGWWYDFGFWFGLTCLFSSVFSSRSDN